MFVPKMFGGMLAILGLAGLYMLLDPALPFTDALTLSVVVFVSVLLGLATFKET